MSLLYSSIRFLPLQVSAVTCLQIIFLPKKRCFKRGKKPFHRVFFSTNDFVL